MNALNKRLCEEKIVMDTVVTDEKSICDCEKLKWYPYDGRVRQHRRPKQKGFSLGGVVAIMIPLCFFSFTIGHLWQW